MACAMAILLSVASAGAAERPNNSDRKKPAKAASSKPTTRKKVVAAKKSDANNAYQIGRASWYGEYFHGRTTASGEPYNMFQFTAAHRQLPLGTYLKVTNLRNNNWVIVRVNDRGPVPENRIIDLSYGAAQMLGLRAAGVERVRLDIVKPEAMAALGAPSVPVEAVAALD